MGRIVANWRQAFLVSFLLGASVFRAEASALDGIWAEKCFTARNRGTSHSIRFADGEFVEVELTFAGSACVRPVYLSVRTGIADFKEIPTGYTEVDKTTKKAWGLSLTESNTKHLNKIEHCKKDWVLGKFNDLSACYAGNLFTTVKIEGDTLYWSQKSYYRDGSKDKKRLNKINRIHKFKHAREFAGSSSLRSLFLLGCVSKVPVLCKNLRFVGQTSEGSAPAIDIGSLQGSWKSNCREAKVSPSVRDWVYFNNNEVIKLHAWYRSRSCQAPLLYQVSTGKGYFEKPAKTKSQEVFRFVRPKLGSVKIQYSKRSELMVSEDTVEYANRVKRCNRASWDREDLTDVSECLPSEESDQIVDYEKDRIVFVSGVAWEKSSTFAEGISESILISECRKGNKVFCRVNSLHQSSFFRKRDDEKNYQIVLFLSLLGMSLFGLAWYTFIRVKTDKKKLSSDDLVELIQLATENQDIKLHLLSIISVNREKRGAKILALTEEMKKNGAPGHMIKFVERLYDENVVFAVKKMLEHVPR